MEVGRRVRSATEPTPGGKRKRKNGDSRGFGGLDVRRDGSGGIDYTEDDANKDDRGLQVVLSNWPDVRGQKNVP